MKPDWQNKGVELYCGDCRKIMGALEADSIDTIITDPVWPDTTAKIIGAARPYELFCEAAACFQRLAPRLIIHLGVDSDPRFLTAIPSSYKFFRACWLEYVSPHYKGRILYGSDMAYVFGPPPKSRKGNHVLSGKVLKRIFEPHNVHPCPRSLHHVKWLVEKFAEPSGSVLDPFMGSGTTVVAAINQGRKAVGIEISREYFDIAVKRIKAELEQTKLGI